VNTWNDIREVVKQLAHTVTEPLENDPELATANRRVLPARADRGPSAKRIRDHAALAGREPGPIMLTAQRTAHRHDTKDHRRTELRTETRTETRRDPGNAECHLSEYLAHFGLTIWFWRTFRDADGKAVLQYGPCCGWLALAVAARGVAAILQGGQRLSTTPHLMSGSG